MRKYLLICVVSIFFTGCKSEVDCSSSTTQNLIKKSFLDSVISKVKLDDSISKSQKTNLVSWIESHTSINISNMQTVSLNKDTGAKSCKASLNIGIESPVVNSVYSQMLVNHDKIREWLNANGSDVEFENGKYSHIIEYNTQMTDDNKTQTIEINGLGSLTMTVGVLNLLSMHDSIMDPVVSFQGVYDWNSMANYYSLTDSNGVSFELTGSEIETVDRSDCNSKGDICEVEARIDKKNNKITEIISIRKIGSLS
jgi:uncharacterized protein YcfL